MAALRVPVASWNQCIKRLQSAWYNELSVSSSCCYSTRSGAVQSLRQYYIPVLDTAGLLTHISQT